LEEFDEDDLEGCDSSLLKLADLAEDSSLEQDELLELLGSV
jgi:hypothetical protein